MDKMKPKRRSGTAGTGVSQKDLRIEKKQCYELAKGKKSKKRSHCKKYMGHV